MTTATSHVGIDDDEAIGLLTQAWADLERAVEQIRAGMEPSRSVRTRLLVSISNKTLRDWILVRLLDDDPQASPKGPVTVMEAYAATLRCARRSPWIYKQRAYGLAASLAFLSGEDPEVVKDLVKQGEGDAIATLVKVALKKGVSPTIIALALKSCMTADEAVCILQTGKYPDES